MEARSNLVLACVMVALFLAQFGAVLGTNGTSNRTILEKIGYNNFIGSEGVAQSIGSGDNLGYSMASGDMDGDGLTDLAVSAPFGDGPGNARNDSGEIYVIFGNDTKILNEMNLINASADMVIYGADDHDLAGQALGMGDINGDGYDDLVIGAQYADGAGNANADGGEIYIIYGGKRTNLSTAYDLNPTGSPPHANATLYGQKTNYHFGYTIMVTKFDSDKYADIFVLERYGDGSTTGVLNAGRVYVIWGRALSFMGSISYTTAASVQIYGSNEGDGFGMSMASGDIDNDGNTDIAFGTPSGDGTAQTAKHDSGEVGVIFGNGAQIGAGNKNILDIADCLIYGCDPLDRCGQSVSCGDFDNDGKDDLLLGSPGGCGLDGSMESAGEVSIVWGAAQASFPTMMNLSDTDPLTFYGIDPFDYFGNVTCAPDLNGDGFHEMMISALGADGVYNNLSDAGDATRILGNASLRGIGSRCILDMDSAFIICGGRTGGQLGFSYGLYNLMVFGADEILIGEKWYNGPDGTKYHCGMVHGFTGMWTEYVTKNEGITFEGLYNIGGNQTMLPGHPATLKLNVSETKGAQAISDILIRINPFEENITLTWNKTQGFAKIWDPLSMLDLEAASNTTKSGNNLLVDVALDCKWKDVNITMVEVLSTGTITDLDRKSFNIGSIHEVEFQGNLSAIIGGQAAVRGQWYPENTLITFGNLTLVFKGTDISPIETDVWPIVSSLGGVSEQPGFVSGDALNITCTVGTNETANCPFVISAGSRGAIGPITVQPQAFSVKVDNATPIAPVGFLCKPDNTSEGYIDDDTQVNLFWSPGSDTGSGIREFWLEYGAENITTNATSANVSGLAEGAVNFTLRALDDVGHIGPLSQIGLVIDLTAPWFNDIVPDNATRFNASEVNVSVTLDDDLTKIESLQYRLSSNGTLNYSDWFDCVISSDTTVTWNSTITFPESVNNYIQWRAYDSAGNLRMSKNLNIRVIFPIENSPPVVAILRPGTGSQHELGLVEFNATGSHDDDGDALTYTWFLGTVHIGSGLKVLHNFTIAGNYTIILYVSDGEFNVSAEVTISVVEPAAVDDDVVDDDDDGGISPLLIILPIALIVIIIVVVIILVMMRSKKRKEEEARQKEEARKREEEERRQAVATADTSVVMTEYEKEQAAKGEYIAPGVQALPEAGPGSQTAALPQEPAKLPPAPESALKEAEGAPQPASQEAPPAQQTPPGMQIPQIGPTPAQGVPTASETHPK